MQYCFLNQSPTFNQLSNKRAPWYRVRNYQATKKFYKFLVLKNLIIYKRLHNRKKINKIVVEQLNELLVIKI